MLRSNDYLNIRNFVPSVRPLDSPEDLLPSNQVYNVGDLSAKVDGGRVEVRALSEPSERRSEDFVSSTPQ